MGENDQQMCRKFVYKEERLAKPRGRIAATEPTDLDQLCNAQKVYADGFIDEITESIKSRFDLTEKPVIHATRSMPIEYVPLNNEEALETYGDEDVQAFTAHFHDILVAKGRVTNNIPREWDDVKSFIKEQKQRNAQLTDIKLWALVLNMFVLILTSSSLI